MGGSRQRATPRPLVAGRRHARRLVVEPIRAFLDIEASSGIVLVLAAVAALVWVNSPWSDAYHHLFETKLVVGVGAFRIDETLEHWIADALMALFFLVVGLEIKQEWVSGELRDRRAAALPALAALGGMVVPAAFYLAVNWAGPGAHGWGIPMATDIAFAVGVLTLLGRRVPSSLKVFLLTLAIVDDVGAIAVIALVYSGPLAFGWLAGAVSVLVFTLVLRRRGVDAIWVHTVLGLALWVCTFESGVHATLAGVAFALTVPTHVRADADGVVDDEAEPPAERLVTVLHPWTSYVVLPLFALASAGVALSGHLGAVTGGVVAGLVVGKVVGITLASVLAVRLGIGVLPAEVGWPHIVGAGLLAGIGFTVSLFVAGLAFTDPALVAEAKIGIIIASVTALVLGSAVLAWASARAPDPVTASSTSG